MNKTLLWNLLAAVGFNGLFAGGTYYTLMRNTNVTNGDIVRSVQTEIPTPVTTGTGSQNGFEPLTAGSNFTIFAKKSKTLPAMVVDGNSGNVHFPQGVIAGQMFDAAGRQIIDADGKWVGDPTGLKGDSCAIDASANITCGNGAPVNVKGDRGDKGDSCAIDASGNVTCGTGPAVSVKGTPGDSCSIDADGNVKCGNGTAVNVKGPKGISDCKLIENKLENVELVSSANRSPSASCPADYFIYGGGCYGANYLLLYASAPLSFPTGVPGKLSYRWQCNWNLRDQVGTLNGSVTASAICCKKD